MSESLVIELHNRPQARAAIKDQLFPFLSEVLQGGSRWVLTIKKMKRTSRQNRRYWGRGVLAQIAEQATSNGKLYSAENWHELFKRKFIGIEELPDGQIIGKSSAKLSTAEFCVFCDQVEAYACADLGVVFYDLEPNK